MLLPNHAIPARPVAAGTPNCLCQPRSSSESRSSHREETIIRAPGFQHGNEIRLSGLAGFPRFAPLVHRAGKGLCRAWNNVSEQRPGQWDNGRARVLIARSDPAYLVGYQPLKALARGILILWNGIDISMLSALIPVGDFVVNVDVEVRCFLPGGEIDMLT